MGQELKLAEFKALYKTWKIYVPWMDHLILGLLLWIEQQLINNRAKVEVDEAVKEWETLHPVDSVSPVYTEKPSDTSTRLPEMRLTVSWYTDIYDEK